MSSGGRIQTEWCPMCSGLEEIRLHSCKNRVKCLLNYTREEKQSQVNQEEKQPQVNQEEKQPQAKQEFCRVLDLIEFPADVKKHEKKDAGFLWIQTYFSDDREYRLNCCPQIFPSVIDKDQIICFTVSDSIKQLRSVVSNFSNNHEIVNNARMEISLVKKSCKKSGFLTKKWLETKNSEKDFHGNYSHIFDKRHNNKFDERIVLHAQSWWRDREIIFTLVDLSLVNNFFSKKLSSFRQKTVEEVISSTSLNLNVTSVIFDYLPLSLNLIK
jgi:hypothetical protein